MILVVEDEFVINFAITQELQQHGCEVVSAFSADEAINVLQDRSDIEVVFTEILTCRDQWTDSGWQPRSAIDGPRSK